MPYATLTFSTPLNVSCQVGDIAYYIATDSLGGFSTGFSEEGDEQLVKIGSIRQITGATTSAPVLIVETTVGYNALGGGSGVADQFIMFTKDNKANLNSPLGYYASAKMVNDSTAEAELFSVGAETWDSSK